MGKGEGSARAHLMVAGRVQGVGFRYAAMVEAEARNVRGWVRNFPDGRVEIVAEGAAPAVNALVAWCRTGPRYAHVYDVDVAWEAPADEAPGFRVR